MADPRALLACVRDAVGHCKASARSAEIPAKIQSDNLFVTYRELTGLTSDIAHFMMVYTVPLDQSGVRSLIRGKKHVGYILQSLAHSDLNMQNLSTSGDRGFHQG